MEPRTLDRSVLLTAYQESVLPSFLLVPKYCLSICPYTSLHSAIHLSVNSKRKEHSSTGDDNLSWHFFLEDSLKKIYVDSLKNMEELKKATSSLSL